MRCTRPVWRKNVAIAILARIIFRARRWGTRISICHCLVLPAMLSLKNALARANDLQRGHQNEVVKCFRLLAALAEVIESLYNFVLVKPWCLHLLFEPSSSEWPRSCLSRHRWWHERSLCAGVFVYEHQKCLKISTHAKRVRLQFTLACSLRAYPLANTQLRSQGCPRGRESTN